MRSGPGGYGGLFERDAELAELADTLSTASEGHGSIAIVLGPPGIGKSRLLLAALDMARERGLATLAARASELERDLPFGVAGQLLGPLPDPGEAPPSSSVDVSYAVIERFWQALRARAHGSAGGPSPLLLAVDDVHWCDRPSLRFLHHVVLRLDQVPVALVLASRPPAREGDALLSVLLASPGARVALPQPFSTAAAGSLLRSAVGEQVSQGLVAACLRATGGVPFYLVELARDLAANTLSVEAVDRSAPRTVLRAVMARLGSLGPEASRLAVAVAVLGDGASLRTAADLAELELTVAEVAADALAREQLVTPDEPLRIVHPLIAATLRSDIGSFALARAHRRAGELLARQGAPVERIAPHLLQCRPDADPTVVSMLSEAATLACARGEPQLGIKLLQRALEEPPHPDTQARIVLQLAEAEASTGSADAIAHLEEAVALIQDHRERVEARLALARTLHHAGSYGQAAAIAEECRREVPSGDSLHEQALASWLSSAFLHPPLSQQVSSTIAPLIERFRSGELPSNGALRALLAGWLMALDEPPELLEPLASGAFAVDPLVDGDSRGAALGYAAATLVCVDALDAAERVVDAAVDAARRRGAVIALSIAHHYRSQVHLHRGRLGDALADGKRSLEIYTSGWAAGPWTTPTLAVINLERGDIEQAETMVAIGERGDDARIDWSLLLEARARLRLAQGRPEDALKDAVAAGERLGGVVRHKSCRLFDWVRVAALAAHAAGYKEEADEWAEEALRRGRAAGRRQLGTALLAAGTVAGGERGVELIREATAALDRSPSRLEFARARLELGAARRRTGHERDAREPLLEALELASAMTAQPLVDRARWELAAMGLRPRRPARAGVASLTPTERRVAELAARGLTTGDVARVLVVNRKTVESHLTRIYRKLGIESRGELREKLTPGRQGQASQAAGGP